MSVNYTSNYIKLNVYGKTNQKDILRKGKTGRLEGNIGKHSSVIKDHIVKLKNYYD